MALSFAQPPPADDPAGGLSEKSSPARRRRDERLALVATAVLLLVLLLPPPPNDGAPSPWGEWPEGTDKGVHAVLFAVETGLLYRALRHRRSVARPVPALVPAAGIALALAFATEALQVFVPGRSGEGGDLAADALGVALGGFLANRARPAPSLPSNSLRATGSRAGDSAPESPRDASPNSTI